MPRYKNSLPNFLRRYMRSYVTYVELFIVKLLNLRFNFVYVILVFM